MPKSYRWGKTINDADTDSEFVYHENSAGVTRKFRRLYSFKPTSDEQRRQFWAEIRNSKWVDRIAPTVRDKQILLALRCFYPDVPLGGRYCSSWQDKDIQYVQHKYYNYDGSRFTIIDAAVLFFKQRGRCRICGPQKPLIDLRPNAPFITRAAADDDHANGRRIRGLLCEKHNKGLGHMCENKGDLGRSVAYLHEEGDYEHLH